MLGILYKRSKIFSELGGENRFEASNCYSASSNIFVQNERHSSQRSGVNTKQEKFYYFRKNLRLSEDIFGVPVTVEQFISKEIVEAAETVEPRW